MPGGLDITSGSKTSGAAAAAGVCRRVGEKCKLKGLALRGSSEEPLGLGELPPECGLSLGEGASVR